MIRCMGCMEEFAEGATTCPHCGHPAEVQTEGSGLSEGTILAGRYIVGRIIGSGGFGITYLGYDGALGRKVAIKEYFPTEFANRALGTCQLSVFTGDASEYYRRGLASFLDEAKRLAAFSNQGNIVAVYDIFEANNTAYIVMEYLEGKTLKELLKEKGKLPFKEAMSIITPVLDALTAVHAAGIIHRDVAPDNIFIRGDGSVALIDFGAARAFSADASKSMTVVLKPGYAPIEQYLSKGSQGPWTDVYASAATLYRMLTGVVPEESMQRALADSLETPTELKVAIPQTAEQALLAALVVEPEVRTQDVAAFKGQLLGKAAVPVVPATPPRTRILPKVAISNVASDTPTTMKTTDAASDFEYDEEVEEIKKFSRALLIVPALVLIAVIALVVFIQSATSKSSSSDTLVDDNLTTSSIISSSNASPASPFADMKTGDHLTFGTYGGQDITWRVLAIEDGRALVITDSIIDLRAYNEEDKAVTWSECTLRKWLNNDFYSQAFSAGEQTSIAQTTLTNPDNPDYGTNGGPDTTDKVFLLSLDEVNRYFSNDNNRIAKFNGSGGWWWLRSPGYFSNYAAYVSCDGYVYSCGYNVDGDDFGVRPALWLNL